MINNGAAFFALGLFGRPGFGGYPMEDNRGQPGKVDYIIWIISTVIFISCLLYGIHHFKYMAQEKMYHGVVEFKWKHPCYHKGHFTYNLLYMEVKFDSIPAKAYIIVTENTYKTPRNSRIAFTLSNRDILRYCYPKKFDNGIWKELLFTIPILFYVVFFFAFGIPLILYFIGFNSWLYKQKET